MLSRTLENDLTGEFDCYRNTLDTITVSRASVTDIPPPKKFSDLEHHPEGEDHLLALLREIESFKENGMTAVPDIDIKDISPELIIQLMPIWHKKYEEKYLRRSDYVWDGEHGNSEGFLSCRSCYGYESVKVGCRYCVLAGGTTS